MNEEPTIEELLERMQDLYSDEWKVTLHPYNEATVEWGWWSDGNPDDQSEGEEPTYEAGSRYMNGRPLRESLLVATKEWTPQLREERLT